LSKQYWLPSHMLIKHTHKMSLVQTT